MAQATQQCQVNGQIGHTMTEIEYKQTRTITFELDEHAAREIESCLHEDGYENIQLDLNVFAKYALYRGYRYISQVKIEMYADEMLSKLGFIPYEFEKVIKENK